MVAPVTDMSVCMVFHRGLGLAPPRAVMSKSQLFWIAIIDSACIDGDVA